MGQDEAATVRYLKAHQAQVLPMIGQTASIRLVGALMKKACARAGLDLSER